MLDQAGHTFLRAHPILTGSAVITLCWLASEGWYRTAGVAVALIVLLAVRRSGRSRRIRHAGLRARADYENMLSAVGDPRGSWGRYPPAGWYPDPHHRARVRYFDGAGWTPACQPTFGQ